MSLCELARPFSLFSTVENTRGSVEGTHFPIFHTPCKGVEKWKQPHEKTMNSKTTQSPKRSIPDLPEIAVEIVHDPIALRQEVEDTLYAVSLCSRQLARTAIVLGNQGYNHASFRTCVLENRFSELRDRAWVILRDLP
jgi:hypothetical protein